MYKIDEPNHFAKSFKKEHLLKWHPKFGHFAAHMDNQFIFIVGLLCMKKYIKFYFPWLPRRGK